MFDLAEKIENFLSKAQQHCRGWICQQQEGQDSNPMNAICMLSCVCLGSLQGLPLPPTVQRHEFGQNWCL